MDNLTPAEIELEAEKLFDDDTAWSQGKVPGAELLVGTRWSDAQGFIKDVYRVAVVSGERAGDRD